VDRSWFRFNLPVTSRRFAFVMGMRAP